MNSKRLFFLLCGLLTLMALGGIASVVVGNSELRKSSAELTDLKVKSLALEEQQRSLVQAKKDVVSNQELETIAKTVVPQEKDQARTVREIIALAEESGIGIANISFPTSTLGEKKSAPAPAAQPAEGQAATPVTPAPAAPSTTQVEPVKGIGSLYQMDINVQGSSEPVAYEDFLGFLANLEQNRRTAQVINLSVQPVSDNRDLVTFNLILRVYIKP